MKILAAPSESRSGRGIVRDQPTVRLDGWYGWVSMPQARIRCGTVLLGAGSPPSILSGYGDVTLARATRASRAARASARTEAGFSVSSRPSSTTTRPSTTTVRTSSARAL